MKKYYHYIFASVTCKQMVSIFIQIHTHWSIIHQSFIEYLEELSFYTIIRTSAVRFWGEYMVSVLELHYGGVRDSE